MNTRTRRLGVVRGLVAGLVVLALAAPSVADWGRRDHDRDGYHARTFVGWHPARRFWRFRRPLYRPSAVIHRMPPRYSYTYVSPYTYGYTYSTSYPTYTTYPAYPSYGCTYSTYSYPTYTYPTHDSYSSAGFHYNSGSLNIRIHVNLDD